MAATTLYHPTIPDVAVEVDSNVAAWVDQGWLKSEPKNAAVKAAKKAAESADANPAEPTVK